MFGCDDRQIDRKVENRGRSGLCRIGEAVAELLARYPIDVEVGAEAIGRQWTRADVELAELAVAR